MTGSWCCYTLPSGHPKKQSLYTVSYRRQRMAASPEQPILVRTIVEMLGTPKEYMVETMQGYIDNLKKDTTQKIISVNVEEPVQQEHQGRELWSTFAELEIKFPNAVRLLNFCYDSMPSSIEVLEPDTLTFPSEKFASLINDILAHLHQINTASAAITSQAKTIDANAMQLFQNFMTHLIHTGHTTSLRLSKAMGLTEKAVAQFAEELVKKGALEKKGEEYRVVARRTPT